MWLKRTPESENADTGYSANAPDGIAGGFTFEETAKRIRGVIQMHLEAMRQGGETMPAPSTRA